MMSTLHNGDDNSMLAVYCPNCDKRFPSFTADPTFCKLCGEVIPKTPDLQDSQIIADLKARIKELEDRNAALLMLVDKNQ